MVISRDLRHLIQTGARADVLHDAALGQGMKTLRQDGIEKVLVQCATLFCTYPAMVARAAFARVTLARMSDARAVQMNGLGSML